MIIKAYLQIKVLIKKTWSKKMFWLVNSHQSRSKFLEK